MERKKLQQIMTEFINAQSQEEAEGLLYRYPELLYDSSIWFLLRSVRYLKNKDKDKDKEKQAAERLENTARSLQMAQAQRLKRVLRFLAQVRTDETQNSEDVELIDEEPFIIEPITAENSVPWAFQARKYLALGGTEDSLEQAILAAQTKEETEIVNLLKTMQEGNWERTIELGHGLFLILLAEGRIEEAATAALIRLALDTESDLFACQFAVRLARLLGDKACVARYKLLEGIRYFALRRLTEAKQAFQETVKIYRELAESQSEVYEHLLLESLQSLGHVLLDFGQLKEAEEAYREAMEKSQGLVVQGNGNEIFSNAMLLGLGNVFRYQGRLDEAEKAFHEALGTYRRFAKDEPWIYKELPTILHNLGTLLDEQGRPGEAAKTLQEAFDICHKLGIGYPLLAMILEGLGRALRLDGQMEKAEEKIKEALALHRKLPEARLAKAAWLGPVGI